MTLPVSRRPGADAVPALRWGVLGTGWIAEQFCGALHPHTSQRVAAVGSRSPESAQRAAARLGAESAYGSYAELVAAPEVDVVYVATPHPMHVDNALLAIEAGKRVAKSVMLFGAPSTRHMAIAAHLGATHASLRSTTAGEPPGV